MFKKLLGRKNAEKTEKIVQEAYAQTELDKSVIEEEVQEELEEVQEELEEVQEELEEVQEEVEEMQEELEEVQEELEKVQEVQELQEDEKKGFFNKLLTGLSKTKANMMGSVEQVFAAFSKIDEEFYEELEEALILADLGVTTSMKIIEDLRAKVKEKKAKDTAEVKALLKEEIEEIMTLHENEYEFVDKKSVVLVIGVNGVGKTTTIGKLAFQYKQSGKKVVLAAADTFRAAAIDQLTEWANRANVEIIAQQENSDPGAVVFDAIKAAKARNADLLICDTAGRLHNKKNLMEELKKIFKIINREYPEAYKEILLVLDSTTGQNALQQAKQFKEITDITGIVLTKLDGTAKGGITIAIQSELNIPVKYIGVGESIEDLQKFNPKTFTDALFD